MSDNSNTYSAGDSKHGCMAYLSSIVTCYPNFMPYPTVFVESVTLEEHKIHRDEYNTCHAEYIESSEKITVDVDTSHTICA